MRTELIKHFANPEISKQMKELGFNEPCLAYYNIDHYLKSPAFNLVQPFDHEWCLPAPLWQQVYAWIYNTHNLVYYPKYKNGGYDIVEMEKEILSALQYIRNQESLKEAGLI